MYGHGQMYGGIGNDTLYSEGSGYVFGQEGDDDITVKGDDYLLAAGTGNDIVNATGSNSTIVGEDGNDSITVNGSLNDVSAGWGDDTVNVTGDYNVVKGDAGNDILISDGDGNVLTGGTGNDVLVGGAGNETYVFNLGDGSDAIADLGGTDVLQINGSVADWSNFEILATKGDDGSFLNLMFSEGENQYGDVTIDLTHGDLLETLKLGDGSELNIQEIYDGALEVSAVDIDELSASLEAVLDGVDGISETGEIVDEVFVETDGGVDGDPLTDDVIG